MENCSWNQVLKWEREHAMLEVMWKDYKCRFRCLKRTPFIPSRERNLHRLREPRAHHASAHQHACCHAIAQSEWIGEKVCEACCNAVTTEGTWPPSNSIQYLLPQQNEPWLAFPPPIHTFFLVYIMAYVASNNFLKSTFVREVLKLSTGPVLYCSVAKS